MRAQQKHVWKTFRNHKIPSRECLYILKRLFTPPGSRSGRQQLPLHMCRSKLANRVLGVLGDNRRSTTLKLTHFYLLQMVFYCYGISLHSKRGYCVKMCNKCVN